MALTVADCLKLGILSSATVLAGSRGLGNIVESVTVFEFDGSLKESYSSILVGNEMTLGAFSYFKDKSPDDFLQFLNKLAKWHVSCIVVFYLGDVLEDLSPRFLELADDLGLPIIAMPRNGVYGYADVIMSVSEAIVHDRKTDAMFISDIISRLLNVDKEKQNNQTLLNFLADEIDTSLILTDDMLTPFVWSLKKTGIAPHQLLRTAYSLMNKAVPQTSKILRMPEYAPPLHLRLQPIHMKNSLGYLIAVNPIEKPFNIDSITQSAEVIRLFLSVWRFSSTRMSELMAMLDGRSASPKTQPKIKHLVVIRGENGTSLNEVVGEFEMTQMLQEYSEHNLSEQMMITFFDGSIVIAGFETCVSLKNVLLKTFSILHRMKNFVVGECNIVTDRSVSLAYSIIQQSLPGACKVFAGQNFFDESKIQFMQTLNAINQSKLAVVNAYLEILYPLQRDREWPRHFETLSTLYLECEGDMAATASRLGLHLNTIKYRMQRIGQLLCLNLESSLIQSRLTLAVAIMLLLS